jgi:flagellar biosynthesis/type III secretory pathway protein FliH
MLFVYVQKRLDMDVGEMEEWIASLPEERRAVAISTYDKIIAKGREEGRREGLQEGMRREAFKCGESR